MTNEIMNLTDLDINIILYLNARSEIHRRLVDNAKKYIHLVDQAEKSRLVAFTKNHRPGATALEIFKAHSQCATVQHAYRIMERLAKNGLVQCEAVAGRGIEFSLVDSVS